MVLQTILKALGLFALVRLTYNVLSSLRLYTRTSSLPTYHHGSSPWALVTGSSDGIGLALAHALATQNFNVLLHGRNPTKLENIRSKLQSQYHTVQFRVLVLDASSSATYTASSFSSIASAVADIHLTVLINNLGGVPAVPAIVPAASQSQTVIDGLIDINLRFPTQITRALWPALTKHRGPALVLTIGSLADTGSPYVAVYGAAKGFNMTWSRGLTAEARAEGDNVEVLGVRLGKVTNVSFFKEQASFTVPDSKVAARAILDKVGCGRAVVVGYVGHAILSAMKDYVPEWLFDQALLQEMKVLRQKEKEKLNKGE